MAIELDHSFTVPVPPDQAWDVLLDVETIAPCMPGATVDEVDGDVVNGRIKVKVGPVSLTYKGTAKFTERNPETRVVVVDAAGKETRGAGTASATVRASLAPDASGSGTEVTMHTTMNVTGRPAQFGRGVMVEVGGKLVEQFAANLAKLIAGETGSGGDAGSGDAGTGGAGSSAPAGSSDTGSSDTGSSDAGTSAGGADADGASAPAATADARTGNGSGGAAVSAAAGPVASTSAPAQEDSLNLVKLAGPVILKRLVPVVIGAASLALLSRLVWRLRHRTGQAEKA
ncbi:MAG TPA: SRPBCC family protein [Streptosporangiaceae bacterium]|jgi:carbon monoxide dehydrogenase subunit G|nr:SRPBCC family protein [Streptosporangiaceae bacterium]